MAFAVRKEKVLLTHTCTQIKMVAEGVISARILSVVSRESYKYMENKNKNNIIQTRDAKKIVASIDNLVENQEKKVIKQIYRCFIEKITFNPRKNQIFS